MGSKGFSGFVRTFKTKYFSVAEKPRFRQFPTLPTQLPKRRAQTALAILSGTVVVVLMSLVVGLLYYFDFFGGESEGAGL